MGFKLLPCQVILLGNGFSDSENWVKKSPAHNTEPQRPGGRKCPRPGVCERSDPLRAGGELLQGGFATVLMTGSNTSPAPHTLCGSVCSLALL